MPGLPSQKSPPLAPPDADGQVLFDKDWWLYFNSIDRIVGKIAKRGGGGAFTEISTSETTYQLSKGDTILEVQAFPCVVSLSDAQDGGQVVIVKNATGLTGGGVGLQSINGQTVDGAGGMTIPIFGAVMLFSRAAQGGLPAMWEIVSRYNFADFHTLTTAIALAVPPAGNYIVLASAAAPITLPDAAQERGRIVVIKSNDGSAIPLATFGGQTIDGVAPGTTSTSLILTSDGANWFSFGGSSGGAPGASAAYTPTVGNLTTPTTTAFFLQFGKYCFVRIQVTGTGQIGLGPTITLPPSATPVSAKQTLTVDVIDTTTNAQLATGITIAGSTMTIGNSVAYLVHGYQITITGWYETT